MPATGTIERIGHPRRAVAVSGLFLVLVTGLAGLLADRRHGLSAAPVVAPKNWPISFQPPAGWTLAANDGDRIAYEDRRDEYNPKQMSLRLTPRPADWSAGRVASEVMDLHLKSLGMLGEAIALRAGGIQPEEVPLGPLAGARINLADSGDYVHVGVLSSQVNPAVVFEYYANAPFNERDARTCAMVAESIVVRE